MKGGQEISENGRVRQTELDGIATALSDWRFASVWGRQTCSVFRLYTHYASPPHQSWIVIRSVAEKWVHQSVLRAHKLTSLKLPLLIKTKSLSWPHSHDHEYQRQYGIMEIKYCWVPFQVPRSCLRSFVMKAWSPQHWPQSLVSTTLQQVWHGSKPRCLSSCL